MPKARWAGEYNYNYPDGITVVGNESSWCVSEGAGKVSRNFGHNVGGDRDTMWAAIWYCSFTCGFQRGQSVETVLRPGISSKRNVPGVLGVPHGGADAMGGEEVR